MGSLARRESVAEQGAGEGMQCLTFNVADELFAMPIVHIKEIIEYLAPTPVPLMPPFIRGVINLRGAVVPVIDLAARFGGEPGRVGKRTCIVIVEMEHEGAGHDVGVVVDSVSEVLEVGAEEREAAPAFGARVRTDFIEAMARLGDRFVIILRLQKVLSVEELAGLVALQAEAAAGGT